MMGVKQDKINMEDHATKQREHIVSQSGRKNDKQHRNPQL